MSTALAKTVILCLLSFGPLLALSFGAVDPYGSDHPRFPQWDEVARESAAMDRLGEAILHRSAVTRAAIVLKNWLSLEVLQFVDATAVLSGSDGWLFGKVELHGAECYDPRELAASIARLDVTMDLAAAGLELVIAVAPDKSTIYSDKLLASTRSYWRCNERDSELLQQTLASEAPGVVDHRTRLSTERAAHPARALYFRTDTHWTPYGAAIGFRQLLAAMIPGLREAALPPPRLTGTTALHDGDLRNALLLPRGERHDVIDERVERELAAQRSDRPGVVTYLLRDSFYTPLVPWLRARSRHMPVLHVDHERGHAAAIEGADRLIVNSVERKFVHRLHHGAFAAGGSLSTGVLSRNMRRAEGCSDFRPAGASADAGDVVREPAGWRPNGPDPRITVAVPKAPAQRSRCLKVSLAKVDPGAVLEVFFPRKTSRAGHFVGGRSVRVPVRPGQDAVTLVLPDYVQGNLVRVDLGAGDAAQMTARSVDFGEIQAAQPLVTSQAH